MTRIRNRLMAWTDVYFLRYNNAKFSSIINIGASSCPELWAWRQLLPDKTVFLIEPRKPKPDGWDGPYLHGALGSHVGRWCSRCMVPDCNCRKPEKHRGANWWVPLTTLDQAVRDFSVPGPYYIWMDVDGAEVDILSAAPEVLKQTFWLHTEVLDGPVGENLMEWLKQHGYILGHRHLNRAPAGEDHLYWKIKK